ncbi:flavodoxin [Methanoculleus sp.]|uniref:flavodoxin family protein n=1 Tax=Methanoculleus sp. TaxID=90427 RepID=UPI001BD2AF80|nr:flavodoxin [Methanoculleus sp.]
MILIAYYSWQGHTEKVATALAKRVGAGLATIEPVSEVGMLRKGMMAMFGMRAAIRPVKTDLSDVDFLVVATPVWMQKVPPYINEYLSKVTNAAGKPFSVLAEMGGSGAENAVAIVKKSLESKGMRFVSSATTLESEVDAGQFGPAIDEFARTIAGVAAPAA